MARVVLVTPDYHCGVVESAGTWPHVGFVYLAGELRAHGHEVIIYDAMSKKHRLNQIIERLSSLKPDVVATSAYTASYPAALKLLRASKGVLQDVTTVMGGIHPTFCWQEALQDPAVDYVVRYEGEETFPELLRALETGTSLNEVKGIAFRKEGKPFATPIRSLIRDLNTLNPAWDLVDWNDYTFYVYPGSRLAIISTSRGCQHNCKFCSQQKFWEQTWRARSVESVTREIEYLVINYKIDVFFISDEYPTADRDRWEAILDWLIQRNLGAKFLLETRVNDILRDEDIMYKYREAGVIHIYVGIEATSQATLNLFNKGILEDDSKRALDIIHAANIVSETSFVLGHPGETIESIEETLEIAKKYNPDFAHFLLLAPWPYADMYNELADHIITSDFAKYNLVEPVIKPVNMTTEQLFDSVLHCYRSFYFGKIPEWAGLKNGFKRRYALQSMKAIMENSFLKEHVLKMGTMPKKIQNLLRQISE